VGDFARPIAIFARPVEVTGARMDEVDWDDRRLGLEMEEESTRAIPGREDVGVDEGVELSFGDEVIGI
jgi:hypothetical protein